MKLKSNRVWNHSWAKSCMVIGRCTDPQRMLVHQSKYFLEKFTLWTKFPDSCRRQRHPTSRRNSFLSVSQNCYEKIPTHCTAGNQPIVASTSENGDDAEKWFPKAAATVGFSQTATEETSEETSSFSTSVVVVVVEVVVKLNWIPS